MKKLTMILAAVVMGFIMTSCGESTNEQVKKMTDEFFAKAEQEVQAIDNVDDFLAFCDELSTKKTELAQEIFEKFPSDGEGNALVPDEVNDFIYERATAYNHVEAAKCGEFLEPMVEHYEEAVDALYYYDEDELDEESFGVMYDEIMDASDEIALFQTFDNIPQDLAKRVQEAYAKYEELFGEEE